MTKLVNIKKRTFNGTKHLGTINVEEKNVEFFIRNWFEKVIKTEKIEEIIDEKKEEKKEKKKVVIKKKNKKKGRK